MDHSVYPDTDHGDEFTDDYDRADYVSRICGAWDFGVPPEPQTVALFRGWRSVFDAFPLVRSHSYHAFRAFFGWPALDIPPTSVRGRWEELDALEERDDPMRDRV